VVDNSAAESAALLASALAVVALAIALWLAVRLGRLQRSYDALVSGSGGSSFTDAIAHQLGATDGLRTDVASLRADVTAARADLATTLRHVGVVRYDAFGDMGGRLSFSAALLDDRGDGVVLTSINGRTETRTYAKGVSASGSGQELSPEEEQAIGYASRPDGQHGGETPSSPARRRSRA